MLIVKDKWLNKIVEGTKRVELRKSSTSIRGRIGLGYNKQLRATCNLVDSFFVSAEWKSQNVHLHQCDDSSVLDKYSYAWVLDDVKPVEVPTHYNHKQGCMIWILLEDDKIEDTVVAAFRSWPTVIEKLLNGLTTSVRFPKDTIPENMSELYVGCSKRDSWAGVLKLGPSRPVKGEDTVCEKVRGGRHTAYSLNNSFSQAAWALPLSPAQGEDI